jgi:non-lysosomal glucosylceramidase
VALTGFRYDARQGLMTFAEATRPARWFWSTGSAWGTVQQSPDGPDGRRVELEVLSGTVRVERLLAGTQAFRPKAGPVLTAGTVCELEPAD